MGGLTTSHFYGSLQLPSRQSEEVFNTRRGNHFKQSGEVERDEGGVRTLPFFMAQRQHPTQESSASTPACVGASTVATPALYSGGFCF